MSDTSNAQHSPTTQTSSSARSPVQGGGLIPDVVRDIGQHSTCIVDGVEAERGTAARMTDGEPHPLHDARSSLGPQSTTRSRGPLQSTSSPPGLDGVHSIGPPVRVAELSASSHPDCLGVQSTALSITRAAELKALSHEPRPGGSVSEGIEYQGSDLTDPGANGDLASEVGVSPCSKSPRTAAPPAAMTS